MVLEEAAYRTGDEHATALAGAAVVNTSVPLANKSAAAYRVMPIFMWGVLRLGAVICQAVLVTWAGART